jgi:drug/metabolite transporter (DMT)-like permease
LALEGKNPRTLTVAYLGLGSVLLIWGIIPVFLKKLLSVLTPLELTFTRFFSAGALYLAFVLVKKRAELSKMLREDIRLAALVTLFGPVTAMLFHNLAIVHVTVATAAVFVAIEPVIVYIIAAAAGQEKWMAGRMVSILISMTGVAMVILSGEKWGASYWTGLAFAALTPVIWAVNVILSKEIVKRHSPVVIMSVPFFVGSVCLAPGLSKHYLDALADMGPGLWLAMGFCVIPGMIYGFTMWYWCLRHMKPSAISVSLYVMPVVTVAGGVAFLGEPMSWGKGAGVAVAIMGLCLTNFRYGRGV